MPLTPEDVRNREFRTAFRGYNEEEVDGFLDEIEAELDRLLKENAELRARATAVQQAPVAQPQPTGSTGEAEEMLRRTLLLAQRTADETVAEAKAEAERTVNDARAQASDLVTQARTQAEQAVGELQRRKSQLESEIDGLRSFEREYRTRLKAYLEAQLRDLEGRAGSGAATTPAPPSTSTTPSTSTAPVARTPAVPSVVPDAAPTPTPAPQADEPPAPATPGPVPIIPRGGDGGSPPEPPPTPAPLTTPMVVTDEGGEVQ
jgi:DivIVA domain-containing protein